MENPGLSGRGGWTDLRRQRAGTVVVFRAADTLDVLARNDLQEGVTATPAIADSTL